MNCKVSHTRARYPKIIKKKEKKLIQNLLQWQAIHSRESSILITTITFETLIQSYSKSFIYQANL